MRLSRTALFLLATGLMVAVVSKPRRPKYHVRRIVRISRVVSDLDRSEAFYRDALGFQTATRGRSDMAALSVLGFGDVEAEEVVMHLGSATVALVRFNTPGKDYPPDSRSDDLWFQHLAIVVTDMDAAYAHLNQAMGWHPISQDGPQLLPPSNGSVRAFKFRDPDGHPLELIWFPPVAEKAVRSNSVFQRVDHSALSISSTQDSLNFYRTLGFQVSDRSLNRGPAQDRLDGLPAANVRVTALQPADKTKPGLELLGYRPPGRSAAAIQLNDTATDWVTIELATLFGDSHRALRDPDGHRLLLVDQGCLPPAQEPPT